MHPGRLLIEAVLALHAGGYGKLRLGAGLSPSGGHWRYRLHVLDSNTRGPHGSIGDSSVFDWGGERCRTPKELASGIQRQFPDLMAAAIGDDAAYRSWLEAIVEASAPDGLFIELWDNYEGKCDHVRLINCRSTETFPHAPPPAGMS
ncbi:hypothetical protein JIN77_12795 [Verrucomicrobiaceae bacterium R5-34]|uniref:Uncharacterized protein n=1 Tax=Oceaniferula flava TaxID=2800421 RepID=A0AAE2VD30_9BACT|nr:hypothetical protein [Oceaniferula flavus]MBK1831609.1 hypothetical protein [Verrucomicrobiaceae bacterium R5-34]MBK1854054.1 hypothetical protein [Oceaniferula flavus]MBM1135360.1 hypothetical protein [Oceaniferula flavus]